MMNFKILNKELLINTNFTKAIEERHSVRKFKSDVIEDEKVKLINNLLGEINKKTNLSFTLVTNECEAFGGNQVHYGQFANCHNYIVLAGSKNRDEEIGYFGEIVCLYLMGLGINSCICALTFKRGKVKVNLKKGEAIYLVIAIGYGIDQGKAHKSKPLSKLSNLDDGKPEWFKKGVMGAILAPTAINQQQFYLEYINDYTVKVTRFFGPCSKMDIGIVKCNFDLSVMDLDINYI